MKIALCTTVIHTPFALKALRKCDPNVRFFIAIDENTPEEAVNFCAHDLDNTQVLYVQGQQRWKCSEAIGWRCIQRRNAAFLAALEWGADIVYSWDSDNLAVSPVHFACFDGPWKMDGIQVTGADGWFDPGSLLIPATPHRGIPHARRLSKHASPITDARIGVAAGLVIGDPDIDATTRMEVRPDIGAVHLLGQTGVVVDPHTWTVFNSQNTAVIRELIPAWFMGPGLGRHDDIFASQIVQRVMREREYHVHFGPPFTLQQRNPHDLLVDLRAEIDGMQNVSRMAELLDSIVLPAKSVIADTRIIYEALQHADWYPKQAVVAALAWLEDCEGLDL
jgi:hypothetical protein